MLGTSFFFFFFGRQSSSPVVRVAHGRNARDRLLFETDYYCGQSVVALIFFLSVPVEPNDLFSVRTYC